MFMEDFFIDPWPQQGAGRADADEAPEVPPPQLPDDVGAQVRAAVVQVLVGTRPGPARTEWGQRRFHPPPPPGRRVDQWPNGCVLPTKEKKRKRSSIIQMSA